MAEASDLKSLESGFESQSGYLKTRGVRAGGSTAMTRTIRDRRRRHRILRLLGGVALAAALIGIIWIDLATGLWQEAVVLSGVAAGLITFALTAFVVDRVVARSQHHRWLPVTRLAITDILRALADADRSELSRDRIIPRSLDAPTRLVGAEADTFLLAVAEEREAITVALARWAGFLAASADVTDLMDHVAELARLLDEMRDRAIEVERGGAGTSTAALAASVVDYNSRIRDTVEEARSLLASM